VALSGGLDSSVLLAALAAAPLRAPLRAIHVDHHLHPDAAHWARHSVELAVRLGVACEVVRVQARPEPGESPEAAARAARYDALGRLLRPSEVLLTAHHGDDQLETVLLQWLRGGGLRALAGMPAVGRFADRGWHARPLLGFTRAELQDWAVSQRLEWLEDPSNLDPRFDRNYLRLEVLPALRRRWPAAAVTVGRVAAQAAEAL
jgi:tRNA(Ile)-lysidine synthase